MKYDNTPDDEEINTKLKKIKEKIDAEFQATQQQIKVVSVEGYDKELKRHKIGKDGYCEACGVLQDGATVHTTLDGYTFILSEGTV